MSRARAVGLVAVVLASSLGWFPAAQEAAATEPAGCGPGQEDRTFAVTALTLPVAYNNWGDFDPFARLLVPTEDALALLLETLEALDDYRTPTGGLALPRVTGTLASMHHALALGALEAAVSEARRLDDQFHKDHKALNESILPIDLDSMAPLRLVPGAQPWTVRAHPGDCIRVDLRNLLPEPASFHVHGLRTHAGQGLAIGADTPDLVLPAGTGTYYALVPSLPGIEGAHMVHSHADARFQTRHGLFGAIVVEPAGSSWTGTDGEAADSGEEAIVDMPSGFSDFREHALFYHDEVELWNAATVPLPTVSPYHEYGPGTKAINLRSEPFMDRLGYHDRLFEDDALPRGGDKSQAYSSYTYGDPGVYIPRGYLGDPTKFRLLNVGPGQHHVHHLHGGGDRWRSSPVADATQFDAGLVKDNPTLQAPSDRLDVQNIGPGESFNAEPEGGAGGVQQSVGDFLYHCHIVEHYVAGMWSFWRVFDTLQPGVAELPDREGARRAAVNSTELLGEDLPDGTVLTATNVGPWIESLLPPPGVPEDDDASIWDWDVDTTPDGPLYMGEPETAFAWPNYDADADGRRPELLFNPDNGRLAWPMLHPHLGKRPPFAANHGPSPYLGADEDARHPDGLCPAGAPTRRYDVVGVAGTVAYNAFDQDTKGQFFVRAEEKAAALTDPSKAKSLVLRANQGDCVDVFYTSQLFDNPANHNHSKSNMHIHLVQFDVQASDGVISGFAYEQSLRPAANATGTGAVLLFAVAPGATSLLVSRLEPFLDANGQPKVGSRIGLGLTGTDFEEATVAGVDAATRSVLLAAGVTKAHASLALVGYEYAHYRWYADVELGMVYWHDHVDGLNSWRHGLFGGLVVEPAESQWCPTRGRAVANCTGQEKLDGHVVDVLNPNGSYRELVLQVQDRTCLLANGCSPDDASLFPILPSRKDEPAGFNLRSEPLHRRNATWPLANDVNYRNPAAQLQKDPATDRLEAYPHDPVVVRLLYAGQGASTGVGTFRVTGHRFQAEQHLPGSRIVDSLSIGISSQHNVRLEGGAGGPYGLAGDYLYQMTQPDLLDRGAWGVFRVQDPADGDGLVALPGHDPPDAPGALPAPDPSHIRNYTVVAMERDVLVDEATGAVQHLKYYTLAGQEGETRPVPLVLRALPGDLVRVKLRNNLTQDNVSITPSLVWASPAGGLGIRVGNNSDPKVSPGGNERWFEWYADAEVGAGLLTSYAKLQRPSGSTGTTPDNHARQGLYGTLVVEPEGTVPDSWTRANATLTIPGLGTVREHVLAYASNDTQFQSSTMEYLQAVGTVLLVNYRTDSGNQRVGGVRSAVNSGVFNGGTGIHSCDADTSRCGDLASTRVEVRNFLDPLLYAIDKPETSLLDARAGEGLVVRALAGTGDQLLVHALDGHAWARDPMMNGTLCRTDLSGCKSNLVSAATLGPGEASNAWFPGADLVEGDHLWGAHRDAFREQGHWGILRVCAAGTPPPAMGQVCPRTSLGLGIRTLASTVTTHFRALSADINGGTCFASPESPTHDPDVLGCIEARGAALEECLQAGTPSSTTVRLPPGAATGEAESHVWSGVEPRCKKAGEATILHTDQGYGAQLHDPASLKDVGDAPGQRCFKASWDRDGDNNQNTQPGAMALNDAFNLRLRYTSGLGGPKVEVSVNGGVTWRTCTAESSVLVDHAIMPYLCDRHPNMRGEFYVPLTL
jgi:FtsP/CotA-like multicopper oxidase with cupredoxin domain